MGKLTCACLNVQIHCKNEPSPVEKSSLGSCLVSLSALISSDRHTYCLWISQVVNSVLQFNQLIGPKHVRDVFKGPLTLKSTYHFPKTAQFLRILTVILAPSILSTRRNLHLKSMIYENDAENETPC